MQAEGYFLYLPPVPIPPRFVLLDENTNTFHDIDLQTARLGNPSEWSTSGISHATLGDQLAIVFTEPRLDATRRAEMVRQGCDPEFRIGRLVAVTERKRDEEDELIVKGKIIGKVNVRPFAHNQMSWEGLEDKLTGKTLPDEMRNGLCGRLWRRPDAKGELVAKEEVLNRMKSQWHKDPKALSEMLSGIFAAGEHLEMGEVAWKLTE